MHTKMTVTVLDSAQYEKAYEKIDFIYNRFDLWKNSETYQVLRVVDEIGNEQYVECQITEGSSARIGGWVLPISEDALRSVVEFIFKNYKDVGRITIRNCLYEIGVARKKNHFRVRLPLTAEELGQRLSSKHRYNLRRQRRLLEENVGPIEVAEYTVEDVPANVVQAFFDMKQDTYGRDYGLTHEQYLADYHVSNIYAMSIGEEIIALALSCEQCEIVFADNFTYLSKFSRYSCGDLMYDYYLKRLIEKGKRQVFLGGGDYIYKRHYQSEEETVYDCILYRNKLQEKSLLMKRWILENLKDTPALDTFRKLKKTIRKK